MWLDASKSDDQYEDHVATRMPGTCEWILNHAAWALWDSQQHADSGPRILWINAPAGFGKSILCASLIQHIRAASEVALAYCFSAGHSQNNRNMEEILRTWLTQLHRENQAVLTSISEMRKTLNTRRASKEDLWTLLKKAAPSTQNCILVLDGLDEYPNVDDSRRRFVARLKGIATATSLRILLTSRREFDIESELGFQPICRRNGSSITHDSCLDNTKALCCHIRAETDCEPQTIPPNSSSSGVECTRGLLESQECNAIDFQISREDLGDDIDLVSQSIVDRKLPKQNDLLRQELALEMADRCDGQFLWLKLQQDLLRDSKSAKALRNIVQSMPEKLHSIYERSWDTVQNLQEPDRTRAVEVLRWLTFAFRPVTVRELAEALVISLDNESVAFSADDLPADIDNEYINGEIKNLCGSLLELREDSQQQGPAFSTVHLVHASVREFLVAKLPPPRVMGTTLQGKDISAAHDAYIAAHCIRFLDCSEVWESMDGGPLAFTAYAADKWMWHLDSSREHHDLIGNFINHFMSLGNVNFDRWEKYHLGKTSAECTAAGPFYWACLHGLISVMELLHTNEELDINAVCGPYGTPITAVCFMGNTEVLERLLSWKADFTIRGDSSGGAIAAAVFYGRYDMLKVMLGDDRNKDLLDCEKYCALLEAARKGHLGITRLLLDSGGNPNPSKLYPHADAHVSTKLGASTTPVNEAATRGYFDVVSLLLEQGADPNIPDPNGCVALHCAIKHGHPDIVDLLIQHDADVNKYSDLGFPLHIAVKRGSLELAIILEEHQANINAEDDQGRTPLYWAVLKEQCEVAKWLLGKGAKMTPDANGFTRLHMAAFYASMGLMTLLLDHGADPNAQDRWGRTPLHSVRRAKENVDEEQCLAALTLLLERGAASISDKARDTPYHLAAAIRDWPRAMAIFLDLRNSIDVQDHDGCTSLVLALKDGNIELAELLIIRGANANIEDQYGWTPLMWALTGELSLVEKILDRNCNMNAATKNGSTPLQLAITQSSDEIIELLIDRGADVQVMDCYGMTCAAWIRRSRSHLKLLTSDEYSQTGPDTAMLREAMLKSVSKIQSAPVDHLGECCDIARYCLLLGMEEDARVAHQQYDLWHCGTANKITTYCSGCFENQRVNERFFACKRCMATDLCESCMGGYGDRVILNQCKDHDFLRIVGSEAPFKPSDTEMLNQWLDRLVEKITQKN